MQIPFEIALGWRYTRAGRAMRRNGFIHIAPASGMEDRDPSAAGAAVHRSGDRPGRVVAGRRPTAARHRLTPDYNQPFCRASR